MAADSIIMQIQLIILAIILSIFFQFWSIYILCITVFCRCKLLDADNRVYIVATQPPNPDWMHQSVKQMGETGQAALI